MIEPSGPRLWRNVVEKMIGGVIAKRARFERPEAEALLEVIAEKSLQSPVGRNGAGRFGSGLKDGRHGGVIRRGAAVALAAVYARFGHTEAA